VQNPETFTKKTIKSIKSSNNIISRMLQINRECKKRACLCVTDREFKEKGRGHLSDRGAQTRVKKIVVPRERSHNVSQEDKNHPLPPNL
jgi:hypothetical protein